MSDNDEVNFEEENTCRRSSSSMLHCQDDDTNQPLSIFLPNELIFQILLLLPVRSLQLFKCVCKSWKTLISDPQFAKTHLQSLKVNPRTAHQALFYDYFSNGQLKIVSFPAFFEKILISKAVEFSMTQGQVSILGSCNGLLCLFDYDQLCVKLWNPSIRYESKKSPKYVYDNKKVLILYFGFGYDDVNDKYKVLMVVSRVDFSEKVTRIYTFGGNSWTTIKNFNSPWLPTKFEGIFVSGTLNWIIVKSDVSSKKYVILSFDLEKETYNNELLLLPLPNNDGVKTSIPVLGVLSNCLCVFFEYSNKTHWDIWLMKNYGVDESWTRLATIPIKELTLSTHHWPCYIEPLFIFGNSIVLCTSTKFVLYNLDDGSLDDRLPETNVRSKKYIYYESLISPQL